MGRECEVTGTVNRGEPCESGLCQQCRVDCKGRCEVFMSCYKGRQMLGSQAPKGTVTFGSGNTSPQGVSYNALRIRGGLFGAAGLPADEILTPERCTAPRVNLSSSFGKEIKTRLKVPINMGAAIAVVSRYWESYAYAAALLGFPIVIGETSISMDPALEMKNKEIVRAPRLEKMLEAYFRYYNGYGAVSVQVNADDFNHGAVIADYIARHYGDRVIIELKLGQGGKSINGVSEIRDLEEAKRTARLLPVWPDPFDPAVQKQWSEGKIIRFTRASALPFGTCRTWQEAEAVFIQRAKRLRANGAKRLTMKTAGLGMDGLALSLRLASETGMDLVTIDSQGGGTAHSPWQMMEHWGVPALPLHAAAAQYADRIAAAGHYVPALSFAGGFAREDHLFKALALGAPYSPCVTMCRALIIPGAVGANTEGALYPEKKAAVNGCWDELPAAVKALGSTPEQLFDCYREVEALVGKEEMKYIPLGTIALWTYIDRLTFGLRQLMCGARIYALDGFARSDISAANHETAEATGIPYITDAGRELADEILKF